MVICVDNEVNFNSSGAVIEGLDSEGPGAFQVWVKIMELKDSGYALILQ